MNFVRFRDALAPAYMPFDGFPFAGCQLVPLVQDSPRNLQLADIVNECPEHKIAPLHAVKPKHFADVHGVAEDPFGVLERIHVFIQEQLQLLLDVADVLREVDLGFLSAPLPYTCTLFLPCFLA